MMCRLKMSAIECTNRSTPDFRCICTRRLPEHAQSINLFNSSNLSTDLNTNFKHPSTICCSKMNNSIIRLNLYDEARSSARRMRKCQNNQAYQASPRSIDYSVTCSHQLSSYLLSSSSFHLTKATKPRDQFNLSSSLASSFIVIFCLISFIANGVLSASTAFDFQNNQADKDPNSIVYQDAAGSVSDLHIECDSNMIVLVLNTQNEQFNGLIYPKGLSKNSTCMVEYNNQNSNNITYILPLRSCNTMSTDLEDGVEYFNTIVVQPHRRLVTNQGKGYHIRCRYQTKEKSITNFFNVTTIGNVPVTGSAPIPLCSMKIFAEDADTDTFTEIFVAENVKIGDKLKLEIKIEDQPVYGMKVTNCLVRDGLNWAEQPLLNDEGCPVDEEILGNFKYNKNLTRAQVSFQAHKFPYTSSVYYQCNVRLCLKQAGGCSETPPNCDQNRHNFRKRRDLDKPSIASALRTDEIKELSVEVYSGLYVNEADNEEEADLLPPKKIVSEQEFCISMRKFIIGVTIASMLLMTAVILLVACILQRRRRRKHISTTCSSIYSGPYSNRGFS